MKTPMSTAKKRIALLWSVWFIVLFIVFFLQSVSQKYEGEVKEAWSWFLPTVLPTLSLIFGILIADASQRERRTEYVDRFLFRLTFFFSIIYLGMVSLTILLEGLSSLSTIKFYEISNLWLAPLQGLMAGLLAFFFRQNKA